MGFVETAASKAAAAIRAACSPIDLSVADVILVAQECNCSYIEATTALVIAGGDLVDAITELTK
jgi:NACalpha-BTF3-like transcription factor